MSDAGVSVPPDLGSDAEREAYRRGYARALRLVGAAANQYAALAAAPTEAGADPEQRLADLAAATGADVVGTDTDSDEPPDCPECGREQVQELGTTDYRCPLCDT